MSKASISSDDRHRADLISQALQDYFDKNPGCPELRSNDAYEILVKKRLVEKDRHDGIKFREFLRHLKNNHSINLIPQCRFEETGTHVNWFFSTSRSKTVKGRNLIPLAEAIKEHKINDEEYRSRVNKYPKLNETTLTPQQLETRVNYPRAYERWTADEIRDLTDLFREIKDEYKLSAILKRQPSAVKTRLVLLGLIMK